jgi:hypothetical protein
VRLRCAPASMLVPVNSCVEIGCDLIVDTRRYYFKLGRSGDPLEVSVCSVEHLPSTRVVSPHMRLLSVVFYRLAPTSCCLWGYMRSIDRYVRVRSAVVQRCRCLRNGYLGAWPGREMSMKNPYTSVGQSVSIKPHRNSCSKPRRTRGRRSEFRPRCFPRRFCLWSAIYSRFCLIIGEIETRTPNT